MKIKVHWSVLSLLIAGVSMLTIGCGGDADTGRGDGDTFPGAQETMSVSGTVSYNERLALTPGATLIVELLDTSRADTSSRVIASQTIDGPGQVPIKFDVAYDPARIDAGNLYSVSARIVESDGRLAFTNDTAYDVLTRGNPNRVDMLLALVEPPPDLVANLETGEDWRAWREVPAPVIWANLIPNEPVPLLRIVYEQSTLEHCARPGNQKLALDGQDIAVALTLMRPPDTPWAPLCSGDVVELDTVLHVGARLSPGRPYRVIVNGLETTTFTVPGSHLGNSVIARSPVQSAEVAISESPPHQHTLRVVSGLPKGSGCSQVNGFEIQRIAPRSLDLEITHHEVADPQVVCTADFPIVETDVPLGSDFEPGAEYTVNINDDTTVTFVAR